MSTTKGGAAARGKNAPNDKGRKTGKVNWQEITRGLSPPSKDSPQKGTGSTKRLGSQSPQRGQPQQAPQAAQPEEQKMWRNNVSLDAPPIDFSYKELKELNDIRYEDSRSGKRKPKQIREDEETKEKDAKNKKKEALKNDDDGIGPPRDGDKDEDGKDKEGDDKDKEDNEQEAAKEKKGDGKEDDKNKEKKPAETIKIIPTSTISTLIQNNNISLGNSTGAAVGKGGALTDANKNVQTRKFKVELISTTLLLGYNKFRYSPLKSDCFSWRLGI
jgi:hypothetical protein